MASGPKSFNIVSLLLLLGVAGAGYWVWKYFPRYFEAFQVDHIIADGASRSYKIRQMREPMQTRHKEALIEEMRKKIVELGVQDPEMTVEIEFEDETVTVTCDYSTTVQHALKDKITVLSMHRVSTKDIKKVDW